MEREADLLLIGGGHLEYVISSFSRAPNLGLNPPLFEPQADTQKMIIDGHIKKRVKRVFSPRFR